jgi:hypothetical protein
MKKPFLIIEYPGDIKMYNRAKALITCVRAEDKKDALRIFNKHWAPRKLNIVVKEL